jgi:hypothetical protein
MIQSHVRVPVRVAQNGQALLGILATLGIAAGVLVYTLVTPASLALEADKASSAALALARDALIGYAAGDDNRPGSLPCPDTDDNGSAQLYVGSFCPSAIGRLPWRTLGLPDPRDGSGERLWYAVSRDFSRNPLGAPPLNTDTAGQLAVTGPASATGVIAVIFAPGAVLGTQVRDAAGRNLVRNYLEGGNEIPGTTTFATAAASGTFNDRLLPLTREALFAAVEMRVAREARAVLRAFFSANGYFPFANAYTDSSHRCTLNQYSGRIPRRFADACKVAPKDPDWRAVTWPSWFFSNEWHRVLFYAVASRCTSPGAPGCAAAGSLLTVTGMPVPNDNLQALLIMPGRALGAQARPCASANDCLEDAENTNGDFVYVKAATSATANDRVISVSP